MNELSKDITKSALNIQTIGQLVKLNKGQDALLKLIRSSVSDSKPLDWDTLVECFYHNVCKHVWKQHYIGQTESGHSRYEILQYDLLESYKANSNEWRWYGRNRVKTWFERSIGTLVVKGQIFIIPTIELE